MLISIHDLNTDDRRRTITCSRLAALYAFTKIFLWSPPVDRLPVQRCGRSQLQIPLQSLPQVRSSPAIHVFTVSHEVDSIRYLNPKLLSSAPSVNVPTPTSGADVPPPGTVKSILPCTPLGVVKTLENIGVYNAILPYGDRAYGKTVTVINRYVLPSRRAVYRR